MRLKTALCGVDLGSTGYIITIKGRMRRDLPYRISCGVLSAVNPINGSSAISSLNTLMDILLRRISPYVLAAIGSIAILAFLPLFLFSVLVFPASHSIGGPVMVILYIENPYVILYSNLIVATLATLLVFFPLSKLLDWTFQKVDQSGKHRRNSLLLSAGLWIAVSLLVIGSFTLATGGFLRDPLILRVFDVNSADTHITYQIQRWSLWFLFLGGIPLVLGGATYWLLLQMSRRTLENHGEHLEGSKSSIAQAEIKPTEEISKRSQWTFLAQWSALNVTGWVVGIGLAGFTLFFLRRLELSGHVVSSILWVILLFLVLGAGISILQWIVVGKFGIALFQWTVLTALGWCIGLGIWLMLLSAVQYPEWVFSLSASPFAVPPRGLHMIHLGLIGTTSMAGAILSGASIGLFQIILLRRFITRPGSWTRAYILGFFIPAALANLIYLVKSLLKRILFSLPFLSDQFSFGVIHMRWTLVFWFCLLAAILGISILTGRVLLKYSDIEHKMAHR